MSVTLVGSSSQSCFYMKHIEDTVNVHSMTLISFPDGDTYEDRVVVSIQPNVYDEFSVQIQIQSLSITDDNYSQSFSQ